MTPFNEQERHGFLKDEYLLLQNHYEDFDRRSLTIKGWIASGAVAALAISFSTAYTRAYLLSISVAAVAAVFWYLEAHWKVFQDAIGDRVRIIEAYFRSDPYILEKNPVPFQAYHQFSASYEKDLPIYREHNKLTDEKRNRSKIRRILAKACNPYVFMPYALIIVASMVDLVVLLITAR